MTVDPSPPRCSAVKRGFGATSASVAGRALRQMQREPTSVIPAVFVPAFFYVVNLGAFGERGKP